MQSNGRTKKTSIEVDWHELLTRPTHPQRHVEIPPVPVTSLADSCRASWFHGETHDRQVGRKGPSKKRVPACLTCATFESWFPTWGPPVILWIILQRGDHQQDSIHFGDIPESSCAGKLDSFNIFNVRTNFWVKVILP